MEALLFILNACVMLAAIVMSLRDERRRPGSPPTSLFRHTDAPVAAGTGAGAEAGVGVGRAARRHRAGAGRPDQPR